MNVGLLLITHNALGSYLLNTAASILGHNPAHALAIDVPGDCDPDRVLERAATLCQELDQGDGVLILTDLYGSTPSNIAARLLEKHNVLIVSGVNVPMLIRVLNYPAASLDELGRKAISGACDGVQATIRQQAS